jgi:hypothetical protein
MPVASVDECLTALGNLSAKITELDPETRRNLISERTIVCELSDLSVSIRGRLSEDGIDQLSVAPPDGPSSRGQIRLIIGSDDLIALTEGELNFAQAWARGRLRVNASVRDLFKLRHLM